MSELTIKEIREAFLSLTRAVTTQANVNIVPRVNSMESTMSSSLSDFVRLNPQIFLGSTVNVDPQKFLVGVYKLLCAMGVTIREKAELSTNQLRYVSHIWYTHWKDNRPIEWVLLSGKNSRRLFLVSTFPVRGERLI